MKKSKYIILKHLRIPIIFPDLLAHNEVADGREVLGAGFCYINDVGHYTCYGKSVSLKIDSDPERDSKILNVELGVIYD